MQSLEKQKLIAHIIKLLGHEWENSNFDSPTKADVLFTHSIPLD